LPIRSVHKIEHRGILVMSQDQGNRLPLPAPVRSEDQREDPGLVSRRQRRHGPSRLQVTQKDFGRSRRRISAGFGRFLLIQETRSKI